jgi:hypothetical protein
VLGLWKPFSVVIDTDVASLIAQWDYGSVEDFAPLVGEARRPPGAELDGETRTPDMCSPRRAIWLATSKRQLPMQVARSSRLATSIWAWC